MWFSKAPQPERYIIEMNLSLTMLCFKIFTRFKRYMTADGQKQDQENATSNKESATAGSGKEDEKVSQTATSEKGSTEKPDYAVHAAQHAHKVSKQQTEKSGFAALVQFVSESMAEARKVTWPDRQQVIKETISVIILVALITACVLAFDFGRYHAPLLCVRWT